MSLLLLTLVSPSSAFSTGRTGSSMSGCGGGGCHASAASASVTVGFSAAAPTVAPEGVLLVEFVVASQSATHLACGLDISASGGTLVAGGDTRVAAGEITHGRPLELVDGAGTFAFSWTAPAAEGTYTLRGAGQAVNGDATADAGDGWSLASDLTIRVDDGCDDRDLDGWEGCEDGSGADCDDDDGAVSPDASEVCDGVDEDCDGAIDDDPIDGPAYVPDADGDGHGDAAATPTIACEAPGGYVTEPSDCDDGDPAVSPDAIEVCDGIDNDCDGAADGPGAAGGPAGYVDRDGDGFDDAASSPKECSPPEARCATASSGPGATAAAAVLAAAFAAALIRRRPA